MFISYSRLDGLNYATALANELTKNELSCSVDLWETSPGPELPEQFVKALRRSTLLVVVATAGAAASRNVKAEIEEFAKTGRTIIVVAPPGAGPPVWQPLVVGLPFSREDDSALAAGVPSPAILSRIVNSLGYTTRNKRVRRAFFATATGVVVITAVGAGLVQFERRQSSDASRARDDALTQKRSALEAKSKADSEATKSKREASHARADATEQSRLSLARRIAAQADLTLAHSDQVSADWPGTLAASGLLAVEANLRLDSRETAYSLRQVLDRLPRSSRRLARGFSTDVMVFDPPGNHLAVVTNDSVLVWNMKAREPDLRISCVAPDAFVFSSDGRMLALACNEHDISVWDVEKGICVWSAAYSNISWIAFGPDRRWLAIAAGKSVVLLDSRNGNSKATMQRKEDVQRVAFSQDGNILATASMGQICLWESPVLAPIRSCLEENNWVEAIEFSPQPAGNTLATVAGRTVSIWDIARGVKVSSFELENTEAAGHYEIHFSDDGSRLGVSAGGPDGDAENIELASGIVHPIGDPALVRGQIDSPEVAWNGDYAGILRDYGIEIWNIAGGQKERRVIEGHKADEVDSMAYARNGQLAIATQSEIWLYDTRSGSQSASLERREKGDVSDVAYSFDERYIAIASGKIVSVWNVHSVTETVRIESESEVGHIAFSEDSRLLAATVGDSLVYVWEIPSGHLLTRADIRPQNQAVEQLDFSPRGSYVLISDSDKLQILNSTGGASVPGLPDSISEAVFSADEKYIAARADNTLTVRDVQSGMELASIPGQRPLCFRADGSWLVTSNQSSGVELRASATGRPFAILPTGFPVRWAKLSKSMKYLITLGDGAVAWDLSAGGREIFRLSYSDIPGAAEWQVAFSTDERFLAVAGGLGDSNVGGTNWAIIWDLISRREVARIKHISAIESIAFSADGRYFGTASKDGTSALLSTSTGREVGRFIHDGPVHKIFFSKAGDLVATASADLVARVWSTRTAEEVAWLNHGGGVYYGRFDDDGKAIITFSEDQRLRVWPLESAVLRSRACKSLNTRVLSEHEWERYVGSEPYRRTCASYKRPPPN